MEACGRGSANNAMARIDNDTWGVNRMERPRMRWPGRSDLEGPCENPDQEAQTTG